MQVTITYCAVPAVNRDRLTTVIPALQQWVGPELVASEGIEIEPLLPDPARIKLKLAFPGGDTSAGPFVHRAQAQADLRGGVVDALSLSLEQFRGFFDALFAKGQLMGSGAVAFEMGGTGEEIPFQLRLHDTAEPFTGWTQAAEGDAVVVTVANKIESTLRIRHLDAITVDAGGAKVSPLESLDGVLPLDVRPSGAARFKLARAQAVTLRELDFSDVEMVPDKQVLYELLLDPSTYPAYFTSITVKAFPDDFVAPPENPQRQVRSIVVDFEGGTTVELTAAQPEAKVMVSVPVKAFVLNRELQRAYRYKVTVARAGGLTADADWKASESGVLFPLLA
jgi:hypothetical protein